VENGRTLTPVYHWLARQNDRFALVELPLHSAPASEFPEVKRMVASTLGWWPLVNGYSGYTPPRQTELAQALTAFPGQPAIDALQALVPASIAYGQPPRPFLVLVHPGEAPLDRTLWEQSGHAEKFGENMYLTQTPDERVYAIKPMNCPGHIQVFKQGIKSYRDLPYYLAEFGKVHRYEPSGALHGLMRVRAFTQDDAHIFCTEDQITEECLKASRLINQIYHDFGFEEVRVKYADRPEQRVGSDEVWDHAEAALLKALNEMQVEYELNPGEGAFYGPKLEFVLRDAIGRDWQCGTVQVDLNMPERLGATYVDADGERKVPVMIHRALFGSLERFCGILIEHHAGHFPLWLAPVQMVVATITDDADDYAREVQAALTAAGLRSELDLRNEKISYKVREHSVTKVPAILVVGKREAEERTVAIRRLGGKSQDVKSLDEAIKSLADEARSPLEV